MRKNSKLRIFKLILVSIIFIFSSCNNKNSSDDFFLGGEIINPSSNYVNFYYNNIKIDSLELDSENKFFKKIENIKPGIYRIEHLPENQYIIIENGDSLWIRVNVEDFKESLTFSGKGSSKNNFLVDISNMDDYENEYLSRYYVEESDVFKSKIDSLMNEKLRIWDLFDKTVDQKKLSNSITKSSIKYNYFNKLERYALLRGTNWTRDKRESYYKYRDEIDLNDSDLSLFEPYVTYLMNYFNEKTLDSGKIYFYEKNNTDFNVNKMQKGNLLPDVEIINFEGTTTSSNIEFKGQKTFIYFWTQTQMNHYRRTIRRVEELKTLYPDYRFVGICIQPYTDMVSQAQNILNLDLTNQYSFQNFEKSSKSWVLTFLNKTIIIDEKSNIIDGFSNLFTNDIEKTLDLN